MTAPFNPTHIRQGDVANVAPAAPRVLDLSELRQVSGGAPRGGWDQPAPGEGQANSVVPGGEEGAPRGGW